MSPAGSKNAPEAKAREKIDALLAQAGWLVQDREDMNLTAGDGIAVREFKLEKGHGYVDYLLFVDGNAVGVVEAKPAGYSFTSVEVQAKKYVEGLPASLTAPQKPLPFAYISTGEETVFINTLDPQPRSRPVFTFHRPETLREWLTADTLDGWLKQSGGFYTAADDTKPSTLRARLRAMPPVELPGLWPNKVQAIVNLEKSLFDDRPRALIQMATGTGKTLLAVTEIYRLIKFGGARRVLFLVDRANLGEQAEKEFQGFRTPDDNRKFNELYNVQRLTSNTIGSSSKVVISTIQRLYSILKGEPELDPEAEEHTPMDDDPTLPKEPLPVVYNKAIPPEFFDVIFIDECHRSIYSLWRQVLEYFDAYLLGLTATPAKHTYGFFNQNVVMEYPHERAVADGVNCDYEVYRIRTSITAAGSTIEAAPGTMVGYRDRQTRKMRWEAPDEDVHYTGADLDRNVVAIDQIRLIVQTFRDKVLKETFPDRTEAVPKTLIFAKDDSHAEDIVKIVREEFGKGNDFCQKITYKVTGAKPADLIQSFRNSYNPRIVVTVDLIATGTDIKPVEIVMFMRSVHSRVLFEQMKGRGVRVINPDELRAVTPDAKAKTHFLIVDCVGVTEKTLSDTKPLEKNPSVSLKVLLDHVAAGGVKDDYLSSLASRLARIDKQCGPDDKKLIDDTSGGVSLASISGALVAALDADRAGRRGTPDVPPERRGHAHRGADREGRCAVEEGGHPDAHGHAAAAKAHPRPPAEVRADRRRGQQGHVAPRADRLQPRGAAEGRGAGEVLRELPCRAQGRDRRPPVLLLGAAQEAPPLQGHPGARQRHLVAAALMDAGEAVARLRDAGEVQGARCVGAAAPDRHRVTRAICPPSRRRACPARRSCPRAIPELAGPAGEQGPDVLGRADSVARHDARPHRDESGDRHGQLRPDPVHERRGLGAGVEGLRQGSQGHRAGTE